MARSKRSFGKNNPNWKGGKFKYSRNRGHRQLVKDLLKENSTCVKCKTSNNLQIDHIVPWSISKELRYEPTNIQILCKECHIVKSSEDGKKYWKNQFAKSEYWIKYEQTTRNIV